MNEVGVQRRLMAILAGDMVGYSRLMELDEAGTLARLRAHRVELIDPIPGLPDMVYAANGGFVYFKAKNAAAGTGAFAAKVSPLLKKRDVIAPLAQEHRPERADQSRSDDRDAAERLGIEEGPAFLFGQFDEPRTGIRAGGGHGRLLLAPTRSRVGARRQVHLIVVVGVGG